LRQKPEPSGPPEPSVSCPECRDPLPIRARSPEAREPEFPTPTREPRTSRALPDRLQPPRDSPSLPSHAPSVVNPCRYAHEAPRPVSQSSRHLRESPERREHCPIGSSLLGTPRAFRLMPRVSRSLADRRSKPRVRESEFPTHEVRALSVARPDRYKASASHSKVKCETSSVALCLECRGRPGEKLRGRTFIKHGVLPFSGTVV
jgi:hypothetical protein